MKLLAQTVLIVLMLLLTFTAASQGTFQPISITFESGRVPQPNTSYLTNKYWEAGVYFSSTYGQFGRTGPCTTPYGLPQNGSAYIQNGTGPFLFTFTNGSVFNAHSVDLAEYSLAVAEPVTVSVIGYRHDGTVVTNQFTTDGVIDGTGPLADFQTFYFDAQFSGLDRAEIVGTGWSMDNLVLSIPEPGAGTLLCAAGLAALLLRRSSRAQRPLKARIKP